MKRSIFKRFTLVSIFICVGLFFSHQANAATFSSSQRNAQDLACKEKLQGTSSIDSCLASCTNPNYTCALATKLLSKDYDQFDENVDCFGCRKKVCEDFGRLGAAAKARCDVRPDFESKPAAPLADGTQCFSCEKIKDQCKAKWPGTSAKKACEDSCTDKAKICAKIGTHEGVDCFACVPKKNPKPPKTCADLGAITNAQCGTCVDPNPMCVPAGFRDGTGRVCFTCAPKPKACKDIGKTNRSLCNDCRKNGGKCITDGVAPNGEQCYTCENRKCADIGKKNRSICAQCKADRNLCLPDGRSPSGERCYECKKRKSCADEGKKNKDVCQTCGEDQVCRYQSTAENGERCYSCKKRPDQTCKDLGLLTDWDCETCEDNPDTKCEAAKKTSKGERCYQCVEKQGCEKLDLENGGCPATCADGEKCVPSSIASGETCHECVPKSCYDYPPLKESCPAGKQCLPVSPDGELQCCDCFSAVEFGCAPGEFLPGTNCGNTCSENQECKTIPGSDGQCENCIDKKGPGTKCLIDGKQYKLGACPGECADQACDNYGIMGNACHLCRPHTCSDFGAFDNLDQCSCPKEDEDCFVSDNPKIPADLGCWSCAKLTCQCPEETDCMKYECSNGECVAQPKTGSCDDGDKCTGQDKCNAQGACVGRPITGCTDCARVLPGSSSNSNCDGQCSKELCEPHPVYGDPKNPGGVAYYCYQCKEAVVEEPKCEVHDSEYPAGTNCGGTCSSDEECKPIAGNDAGCETCVEKPKSQKRCEDLDQGWFTSSNCNNSCAGGPDKCFRVLNGGALECYECGIKDICPRSTYPADDCRGNCDYNEKCLPISESGMCYDCFGVNKLGKTCLDIGYKSHCEPPEECTWVQDGDLHCCSCSKEPVKEKYPCPEGAKHGQCFAGQMDPCKPDGACIDRSTEGATCYSCRPTTGATKCYEPLKPYCATDEECIPTMQGDVRCCQCQKPGTPPPPPPKGCPKNTKAGSCDYNGTCIKGKEKCRDRSTDDADCHICQPITGGNLKCNEELGWDWAQSCPSSCESQDCESKSISGSNGTGICYRCKPKPKYQPCPAGSSAGSCLKNGGCPERTKCTVKSATEDYQCVYCRPMTGASEPEDEPIGSLPGNEIFKDDFEKGDTTSWGTETGTTTSVPGGGGIATGEGGLDLRNMCGMTRLGEFGDPNCYGICDADRPCQPVAGKGYCFACQPRNQCEVGLPGACRGTCKSGQICMSDRIPCHLCITPKKIEIEYIVIIIETPVGRYVLDESQGFEGFQTSQVMALAKVETSAQGIKQLAGMMPGFSDGLGFLNMAQSMSLESLAGQLAQGLEKGRKYSDDCFEDDFTPVDAKGEVPSSSPVDKKAQKKDEAPEKSSDPSGFGQDAKHGMTTGSPILACGTLGKEKALAVFDAAGKPIDVILKDQLKKNPNAVEEALLKAEGASQLVNSIRQQGIQTFAQNKAKAWFKAIAQEAVSKVGNKVKPKPEKVEEDKSKKKKKKKSQKPEIDVVPNDTFYPEPVEEEKKKLFGILGSSKPVKVNLGSGMRMGMNTIGAGSDRTEGRKEELINYQWGLHEIGFTPVSDSESAWNYVDQQTRNVTVAVIDSGLDLKHVDGPQFVWINEKEIPNNGKDDDGNGYIDDVNGWNFLNNNNDLTDEKGHGTFVAGIIAAKWNNGIGIAGINPGAVIMPIKVADEEGETNSFDIFRAINYAVDNGARVINVSLGSRTVSELEHKALNYARAMGVFVVMASGNIGENISEHGPASGGEGFAVGSIDISGERSTISNWGANNGLLAPGEQVYSLIASGATKGLKKSLVEQGYYPQSGTSFSTPMVAATASLLLAQNPHLTPDAIEDILHRSADDLYEEGWDGKSGAGRLNATAALSRNFNKELTVKITEIRINRDDRDRIESVDVFGTVYGDVKSYVVEVGRGKYARGFDQVAGPFKVEAQNKWLVNLPKDVSLRGSDEWIVKITAVSASSQKYSAETLLELK